jgi:hypothetical protein
MDEFGLCAAAIELYELAEPVGRHECTRDAHHDTLHRCECCYAWDSFGGEQR